MSKGLFPHQVGRTSSPLKEEHLIYLISVERVFRAIEPIARLEVFTHGTSTGPSSLLSESRLGAGDSAALNLTGLTSKRRGAPICYYWLLSLNMFRSLQFLVPSTCLKLGNAKEGITRKCVLDLHNGLFGPSAFHFIVFYSLLFSISLFELKPLELKKSPGSMILSKPLRKCEKLWKSARECEKC